MDEISPAPAIAMRGLGYNLAFSINPGGQVGVFADKKGDCSCATIHSISIINKSLSEILLFLI
jgi:hypothetical protein